MKIKRVEHIAIAVDSINESLGMLRNTFGIVTKWINEKGTGLFHICFEVEDIDAALAELKQKGVKLRDETPRPGHGGSRIAFIDPSATGNVLIELAELPAGHGAH